MRSLADLDEFCVEIRVPLGRGWSKGSGYLIGPYRVLTALHVLVGEDAVKEGAVVSAPGQIQVRAWGDFSARFGRSDVALKRYIARIRSSAPDNDYLWRPATVLWPPNGVAGPRYDLAILEVKPGEATERISAAPPIVCIKPTRDLMCRGTGFPEWLAETIDNADVSSPRPVTGVLTFGDQTQRTFHPFTATNGGPENSDEWKRISGTAFFVQDTEMLIGVASAVFPTKGNNGLWLTQLTDLAQLTNLVKPDEFDEFWAAAGMPRPSETPAPETSHRLLQYLYEFDRGDPEDRVLDFFEDESGDGAANSDGTRAPLVFLIAGRWKDLPDEMVRRIRLRFSSPGFMGDGRAGDHTELRWRYANVNNPEQVMKRLRTEIAQSLNVDPRTSFDSLCDRAKCRDWSLIIEVDKASDQDAKTLCKFLAEFAKFGRSPQPPSLCVQIVNGAPEIVNGKATRPANEDEFIASFIKLIEENCRELSDRIAIVDGIYLEDCEFVDIQYWSKKLEKDFRLPTAEQWRIHLEQKFPNGTYALRDVKYSLNAAGAA
jgi:hypothetical protein